ncbi:MAG: transketolase [Candidatus Azotimanducaceae bacterium]|uniref:Transketolase n=1 Tax=OM182 bacterium TaxID=2510334 RepID=A0A520S5D9_9GAMM|nr:MAG: transketolase [OM182 bacterium]
MISRKAKANAIRALSMDAVQKANSGHPGAPMGMADVAEVLWADFLKHNPTNPDWHNRDRFILSNGHGSMLLYSVLHLSGYEVSIEDIKNFRQLGSKTPGHPEYNDTPGVETTTGPLGQGLANAVGMALAEKILASRFNRENYEVVDHYTYAFVGDGCLMEGISHEVASLAGVQKLSKLICIYDDNGISIDGNVEEWFIDNTPQRFKAYGWHVIDNIDGHNSEEIIEALKEAKGSDLPTLICCKTIIGFGSPTKSGTSSAHGSPLGDEEILGARKTLDWHFPSFEIPEEYMKAWDGREKGQKIEALWKEQFTRYSSSFPELAKEYTRIMSGSLPELWEESMNSLLKEVSELGESKASRVASSDMISALASVLPELIGGSADLTGSNLTSWANASPVSDTNAGGNYIYYGVREFGMTAISSGLALHGGLIPFSGTFLTFMEYGRNAVRMSALMGIRNILVYTHDSIGQGEDGPTHQPVEQLANLRSTPNMVTWRPCDSLETVVAWQAAIERTTGPSALIFSRQSLVYQSRNQTQIENIRRGAYILRDSADPVAIVIATGSEVEIAVKAHEELLRSGISVRVVSMPSAEIFENQEQAYRDSVLPSSIRCRLAVEAAHPDYWRKWVGLDGDVIGLRDFGASGPGKQVFEHFGFTSTAVVSAVKEMI